MSNNPFETLRDGNLKATIWKNTSDENSFFSVEFTKFYKDDQDEFQDTNSFNRNDLLRVARLAHKAYDLIEEASKS